MVEKVSCFLGDFHNMTDTTVGSRRFEMGRVITGTFEVRFTEFASLRLEWRHDQSNEAFFLGHQGLQNQHHQDTATVELNVRF